MRALRVDKITLAILEATLAEYAEGRAATTVPVQRMLHLSPDEIEARAQALAATLATGGWHVAMISGSSAVGGGSAPGVQLPTVLLSIARDGQSAATTEQWLRALDPPVIARIEHDRVVLDLRTVAARSGRHAGGAALPTRMSRLGVGAAFPPGRGGRIPPRPARPRLAEVNANTFWSIAIIILAFGLWDAYADPAHWRAAFRVRLAGRGAGGGDRAVPETAGQSRTGCH